MSGHRRWLGGGGAITRHVIATVTDIVQDVCMAAYAMAHLRTPQFNDDVLEYIEKIQGTLDPYSGRFLVHGPKVEVMEGTWPGTVVIIEFPGVDDARSWYESPAYQEILPLRTNHIEGDTLIVEGVAENYDAKATAAAVRARQG